MQRTLAALRLVALATLFSQPVGAGSHADSAEAALLARNFSYIVGMQAGNNFRKQLPHAAGDIDLEAMLEGFRDALERREPRMDLAEMTFWSGKFLNMLEERRKASGERNAERGAEFRAEYAKREDVRDAGGGILYRELTPGEGRQPGLGQTVVVHYTGQLLDGRQFDSSRKRGQPLSIAMRDVIPGWQNALSLMQVGAKWQVVLPPEQAYGQIGNSVVGPSETLIFELELLDIE